MYNNYRHILPAETQATRITPIGATDIELASFKAPPEPSKLRETAVNALAAAPFAVALVMIVGFGLAIYPLVVHFLPTFLAQSALA